MKKLDMGRKVVQKNLEKIGCHMWMTPCIAMYGKLCGTKMRTQKIDFVDFQKSYTTGHFRTEPQK